MIYLITCQLDKLKTQVYILISESHTALLISASVTLLALFGFGVAKGYFTGVSLFKSGFQTVFVGGMAAGAAYLLAKAIS